VQEQSIFIEALEHEDPAARAAFLDRACAGDPALRQRIERLLLRHQQPDSFLESPVVAAGVTADEPISERPGTILGPYKLREQIGEGAFGIVFMAEQQQPVRRKVALKVLKPGMDTRQVVARFEAERQALALMDHENIAKVFDAGDTGSGRPYFVMELVRGVPITDYCDQNQLVPRERLELFVAACQAVQHAHHKGIIHRDLKPSNILVTLHDGTPVVKVIDFGIAKALGQRLTDKTLFTGFAQMIGTPLYMSPEQAELSGLDIDTRSDIYSLGVLLYELLTGTTPLEKGRMSEVGYDELRRLIREEEPPKPSTRITTLGAAAATVSARRKSDPRRLSQLFRGELDWIVMKALEKDRSRRYETVSAFAADVQRYLDDEAVQACPPSAGYRFRKFARRNRTALVTATLVALALVIGTVVSLWQAVRATQAETLAGTRLQAEFLAHQEANANLQKAQKAVDDYFTLVSASPLLDTPGLETLRKQLLETALAYYKDFINQRGNDPLLLADVAAANVRVAQITYLNGGNSNLYFPPMRDGIDAMERLIEEGRDTPEVQQRLSRTWLGGFAQEGPGGTVPVTEVRRYLLKQVKIKEKFTRDNPGVPEFQNDLAGVCSYVSLLSPGEEMRWSDRSIEIWQKLARQNPKASSYRLDLARTYERRAEWLKENGRGTEADKELEKSLVLRRELARDFPERGQHGAWLAVSYRTLAETQIARNQPQEAEKTLRQAVELQQKLVADFPSVHTYQDELARTLKARGALLHKLKRSQEAEAAYRQALGIFERLVVSFPRNALYRDLHIQTARELAQLLEGAGQPKEAAKVLPEAMGVYQKLAESTPTSAEDGLALFAILENLANLSKDMGRPQEAEKLHEKASALLEKLAAEARSQPQDKGRVAESIRQMAFAQQGKLREKLFREAAKLHQEVADADVDPPTHRYLAADSYVNIGLGAGKSEERIAAYRKAIELLERQPGEFLKNPGYRLRWSYNNLSALLKETGRTAEADKVMRRPLAFYEKLAAELPDESSFRKELANSYLDLGRFLRDSGKAQDAEKSFGQALALWQKLFEENPGAPDERREFALAQGELVLFLAGDPKRINEAQELHGQAVAQLQKLAADFPSEQTYLYLLADMHRKLGDAMAAQQRGKEALEAYEKAMTLFESLAANFLAGDAGYGRRYALNQSYANLINLLRTTNRSAEAARVFRRSIRCYEKLATK
jgi:serine/threonine protein kinase/tetratricopeptide (TPR) repeat protein